MTPGFSTRHVLIPSCHPSWHSDWPTCFGVGPGSAGFEWLQGWPPHPLWPTAWTLPDLAVGGTVHHAVSTELAAPATHKEHLEAKNSLLTAKTHNHFNNLPESDQDEGRAQHKDELNYNDYIFTLLLGNMAQITSVHVSEVSDIFACCCVC